MEKDIVGCLVDYIGIHAWGNCEDLEGVIVIADAHSYQDDRLGHSKDEHNLEGLSISILKHEQRSYLNYGVLLGIMIGNCTSGYTRFFVRVCMHW